MRLFSLFKYGLKKLILNGLYTKYVKGNNLICEDIDQNLKLRGSKLIDSNLKKKFHHLMLHYPEYVLLFLWRANNPTFLLKNLFVKDFKCKIFSSTKIGGGLACYHPFATVINAKSIGYNFEFRNSLTIGNKNNDNSKLPTIGNNVTVGAQVVIIGDIVIGDHVIIGAGSVVVKDIPSYSVVAGNPAKVIKNLAHA